MSGQQPKVPQFYHFECPVCEFDDKEAGALATERRIYCGMCAGDNGRDVLLVRWPEGTERPKP